MRVIDLLEYLSITGAIRGRHKAIDLSTLDILEELGTRAKVILKIQYVITKKV